ncbi:MAG: hypothetical protein ACRD2Z_18225 [Thermoanaerobaculia bacterium]
MSPIAFDPERILRTLAQHHVRYVLIGGLAGRLWGSPTITNDLDLCYARDRVNLERLAEALRALGARLRGVDADVPFLLDAETLERGDHFTFATVAGNLDILGHPAGSRGYEDLLATASDMQLAGQSVAVVDLDDLIAMKRAAARPKDRIEVEVLGALRDELSKRRR